MKTEKDFRKVPDKKKEPFSYYMWKVRGMIKMTPEERVLMYELANINSFQSFIFRDANGAPLPDRWDIMDMKKFVKAITPKIIKEYKRGKNK